MWYVGYARKGHEFEVEEAIAALGIEVWVPRKMDFQRLGKKREVQSSVKPYMHNYVFMDLSPDDYHRIGEVKYLSASLLAIPGKSLRYLTSFRSEVQDEYDRKQAIWESGKAVDQYWAGQALRIISGPFMDQLVRFKRTVEAAHDMYPKIEAAYDMMGREVEIVVDPLNVKAAE